MSTEEGVVMAAFAGAKCALLSGSSCRAAGAELGPDLLDSRCDGR